MPELRFTEVVRKVSELLEQQGRVSYRLLIREFDLEAEEIEDLKAELIDAQRVATDEEGKVLVWSAGLSSPVGESTLPGAPSLRAVAAAGERRQVTVMFCDMVGFTELAH